MKYDPGRELVEDPYLSYRFSVKIDGIKGAGFSEVTGLVFETEIETFREGGNNTQVRQLAGPSKCPDKLVLKKGLSGKELWQWYNKVMSGKLERKNVAISLIDYADKDISKQEWVFIGACPVKWTGPQFRAGTAEVAFETIELIHKGLNPGR